MAKTLDMGDRIAALLRADVDDATFRFAIERMIGDSDRRCTIEAEIPTMARRLTDTVREVETEHDTRTVIGGPTRRRRVQRETVAYKVQYVGRRSPDWLPDAYREVWDALVASKGK